MSRIVQEAELSALLDGELDPVRAAEVHTAIAADAVLRAAFERLTEADAMWSNSAKTARFQPAVRLVTTAAWWNRADLSVVLTLTVLLAVGRVILKLAGSGLIGGMLVNALMLTIAAASIVWLYNRAALQFSARPDVTARAPDPA